MAVTWRPGSCTYVQISLSDYFHVSSVNGSELVARHLYLCQVIYICLHKHSGMMAKHLYHYQISFYCLHKHSAVVARQLYLSQINSVSCRWK
jgi:hypothetical protein